MRFFMIFFGLLPFLSVSEINLEEPIPPVLKSYIPTKAPDNYESAFYSSVIIIVIIAIVGLIISIFGTIFCVKPAVSSLRRKKNQFQNLHFSDEDSEMEDIP